MSTAINTIGFVGIVICMGYVGPALDEFDAAKHQRQQQRVERAAQEMCGNGVAVIEGKTVTCKVRKALRQGSRWRKVEDRSVTPVTAKGE